MRPSRFRPAVNGCCKRTKRLRTGPADENPYLRPGETPADANKPVPGLLEEAQAKRRAKKGNGHAEID